MGQPGKVERAAGAARGNHRYQGVGKGLRCRLKCQGYEKSSELPVVAGGYRFHFVYYISPQRHKVHEGIKVLFIFFVFFVRFVVNILFVVVILFC